MKKLMMLSALVTTLMLGGCVVAPTQPLYAAPPGVVYVGPTYAIPGPGYVWAYHVHYGWGWYHPKYGWHRGWR